MSDQPATDNPTTRTYVPDGVTKRNRPWTVGVADETTTYESYNHYGTVRLLRRVKSLARRYKDQPAVHIFVITPVGETTRHYYTAPDRRRAAQLGGLATAAKRSASQRAAVASKAARARWNKQKESTT